MKLRENFHKARRATGPLAAVILGTLLACYGCADADAVPMDDTPASPTASDRGPASTTENSAPSYPPAGYAWVIFGADTVVAEVAATADERAEGLMYRDAVPDGTGMLFVFEDSRPRAFWMANTYVALDIAYLDPSYRIVDVIAMEPLDTDTYPSSAPAMFALEVRQGWFAEHGIAVGAQANIVFGVQGR